MDMFKKFSAAKNGRILLLFVFFFSRILKEFSYLSLSFIKLDNVLLECLMLPIHPLEF
jgi:hypothetical protein